MLVFIWLLLRGLSDEYPFAGVSVIFQVVCIIGQINHQQCKG